MLFDQHDYQIRCEWGGAGIAHLASSDVVIVVDVLSFTTCVDIAVGRGATVLPYRWKDHSAAAYAREQLAELASPRRESEDGYSLAPSSLTAAPSGLRLVLPSPNGSSLAFAAISSGALVIAGCLRNASAVAKWAQEAGTSISVIPAGERWSDGSLRPAIEDLLGAGAIIRAMSGTLSPESSIAVSAFEGSEAVLRDHLRDCSSGRELRERGFAADVELAAEVDVSRTVPVLRGDAFVASDG